LPEWINDNENINGMHEVLMSRKKKIQKLDQPFGVKSLVHLQTEIEDQHADEFFDIKDITQCVFDRLVEDFKPEGLLEELWMYDIARITMNIEKFRTIELSVMLNQMLQNVQSQRRSYPIPQNDEIWFKIYAEEIALSQPHLKLPTDQDTLKVVPNLSEEDIRKLAAINDLISKQQRERDRIYAQFERKRRPLIEAAVTKFEDTGVPPQLSD